MEQADVLRAMPSRLLAQAAALFTRRSGEVFDRFGLHRHQFAVLATLDAFGAQTQADLCRRTALDRSDMTAMLMALEQAGRVERVTDPASRRQKLVSLTAEGQSLFRDVHAAQLQLQGDLLAPLAADDRHRLIRSLQQLVAQDAVSK